VLNSAVVPVIQAIEVWSPVFVPVAVPHPVAKLQSLSAALN